jgi:flagellar hook-associated protein 1 FlgK
MTSIPAYTGLDTALRGPEAAQAGIDTTGHNIANANTPGYSRQVVDLTEAPAYTLPGFSNVTGAGVQLGTGVDLSTITRVRNQFLDVQYRAQSSAAGHASTTAGTLQQVQAALDEPTSNGLASQLSAFWKAWSSLANDPQSLAARQAVVDAGTTVTQTLNALSQQLSTIQSQTAEQYAALTASPSGQVITEAKQIAALNTSISQQQAAGQVPNDLLDQRDQLIDQLSSLANVSVINQPNGMVSVAFGDAAQPLIDANNNVNWPQMLTSAAGGQLGALLGLSWAGGTIATYQSSLNGVASQLIGSVNAVHAAMPFFGGNSAATIAVAVTPANVQTGSTGAAGANDIALAIAGLSGGAADQAYDAFVSGIGSDVQASQSTQQNAQALLSAIDNQRQSVSGVSLDEEMTNLITFQRAYQASARMMTTVDSALDTLINRTGTVGL